MWYYFLQGRRRLSLKSGTAMERRSRFSECRMHEWGGVGGGYDRWITPLVRGCGGRPQENFLIQDVCWSDSNAFWGIFFLSYQDYFTSISCIQMLTTAFWTPHQQCINNCFDTSVGLIKRWHQTWQFACNSDTDICCCYSCCCFVVVFWGEGGVVLFFSVLYIHDHTFPGL